MQRYILTGTPGSGKTTIIRELQSRGFAVVEEAATDVIALEGAKGNPDPWKRPDFIDQITRLQRQRQLASSTLPNTWQFYDRSPICTYALSRYLGYVPSAYLLEEIQRIEHAKVYQKQVFFLENLGFCEPTEARKITFAEALLFETIHAEVYSSFGYELIKIPASPLLARVARILEIVSH